MLLLKHNVKLLQSQYVLFVAWVEAVSMRMTIKYYPKGIGTHFLALNHTLMIQNVRSFVHVQNTFGKRISDTT